MAIHLGRRSPDGSCGLPEGWAAPLSPVDGCPPSGCALLFGLAPGRVCRVSLRSTARAVGRHRHCGTGPRLTADGRYPPPCAAELGLSSRRRRVTPPSTRDHPTASLTAIYRGLPAPGRPSPWPTRSASGRAPHDRGRAAGLGAVDGLVGQRVGHGVLGARDVRRGPALEAGQGPRGTAVHSGISLASLTRQRPQLLDDELRVEQQVDLAGARARAASSSARTSRCTRRRCWSGPPGSPRSTRPGRRDGRARPAGRGRTAPPRATPARDCRGPRRRSG